MQHDELVIFIEKLFTEIGNMIPVYMKNPEDSSISNGHVAVCIIDESGQVYGKMFGENRVSTRQTFKVAWTKASQVWITGMKTGEYEKKVFNDEIKEERFGIRKPDLIGWEGGQPIILKDGTKLAAGFSGFRGIIDLEIVVKAIEKVSSN